MNEESPFERIMKASKAHIQASEKDDQIQEICAAIGERRIRDLLDSLGKLESSIGWSIAIDYLTESSTKEYPVPVGQETTTKALEPLKYREVLFGLFDCAGLEPVNLDTDRILEELSYATSFVSAQTLFKELIHDAAYQSIEGNDTLFFEIESLSLSSPDDVIRKIESHQIRTIEGVTLSLEGDLVYLKPLWYSEYGRRALAELGIRDLRIPRESLEIVISVLQVSTHFKERILQSLDCSQDDDSTYVEPINPLYKKLLDAIIYCDAETLRALGSRHAYPIYNQLLKAYADSYRSTGSSSDYRNLLLSLRNHVSIRWNDSIIALAELSHLSDSRITVDVINALGNFYHEATTSALLDIFCRTKNRTTRDLILRTIMHLDRRCPETQGAVHKALNQECMYNSELRRFYQQTWKT